MDGVEDLDLLSPEEPDTGSDEGGDSGAAAPPADQNQLSEREVALARQAYELGQKQIYAQMQAQAPIPQEPEPKVNPDDFVAQFTEAFKSELRDATAKGDPSKALAWVAKSVAEISTGLARAEVQRQLSEGLGKIPETLESEIQKRAFFQRYPMLLPHEEEIERAVKAGIDPTVFVKTLGIGAKHNTLQTRAQIADHLQNPGGRRLAAVHEMPDQDFDKAAKSYWKRALGG